jgi:catechol 2,3-dioxygenase-like lactoylglutathione lyase family enzyme
MKMKLELVPVPVTDVDVAKGFYTDILGFVVDVDVQPAPGVRVVQLTPPDSACSIMIGTGLERLSTMTPGTIQGLHLVVDGIEGARAELIARGADVAQIVEMDGVKYAQLADPDGNTLVLQEMPWRTGQAF